jgi:hypothetical protein
MKKKKEQRSGAKAQVEVDTLTKMMVEATNKMKIMLQPPSCSRPRRRHPPGVAEATSARAF